MGLLGLVNRGPVKFGPPSNLLFTNQKIARLATTKREGMIPSKNKVSVTYAQW